MPITKSAKKATRSTLHKKEFNLERKDAMKSAIKTVKKLTAEKKNDDARESLSLAYKAIDKAFKRGVIKKNAAPVRNLVWFAFVKKSA